MISGCIDGRVIRGKHNGRQPPNFKAGEQYGVPVPAMFIYYAETFEHEHDPINTERCRVAVEAVSLSRLETNQLLPRRQLATV